MIMCYQYIRIEMFYRETGSRKLSQINYIYKVTPEKTAIRCGYNIPRTQPDPQLSVRHLPLIIAVYNIIFSYISKNRISGYGYNIPGPQPDPLLSVRWKQCRTSGRTQLWQPKKFSIKNQIFLFKEYSFKKNIHTSAKYSE